MDVDIDGFHHRLVSPANDLSCYLKSRHHSSAASNNDIWKLMIALNGGYGVESVGAVGGSRGW
jgi:hypothetical protein